MYEINYINTHYVPFEMERNYHEGLEFRLAIKETTDVARKRTDITAEIQYKCNADIFDFKYSGSIKINGNKRNLSYTTNLFGDGTYRGLILHAITVDHDSNGNARTEVEVVLKADEIWIIEIYQTKGTASYSAQIKQIDMSAPQFESISVSADRYGKNASARLTIAEHSYRMSGLYLELYGLTYEQYRPRPGGSQDADGTYHVRYGSTSNLYPNSTVIFDLDSSVPLDSGKSYKYIAELYSPTGVYTQKVGYLRVPQKVTSLTCESSVELMAGGTKYLEYQVLPSNAEEQSVTFKSSNEYVATVDEYGTIEAHHNGTCFVTVTTKDGGFTGVCEVTVTDNQTFPKLTYTEYLSETVTGNIISAILFLQNRLTEKGVSVPSLPTVVFTGKSHNIKEICNVLETIESCCQILKTASNSRYPCSSLPKNQSFTKYNEDKQWFLNVNEWINFLNELNEKTK